MGCQRVEQFAYNCNLFSEKDVNAGWSIWKSCFESVSNIHAPIVERRLKDRHNPWITPDIVKRMCERDYLHRKAVSTNDQSLSQYEVV